MRGEGHILVYCPIDTLQWGSTHSAVSDKHCQWSDSGPIKIRNSPEESESAKSNLDERIMGGETMGGWGLVHLRRVFDAPNTIKAIQGKQDNTIRIFIFSSNLKSCKNFPWTFWVHHSPGRIWALIQIWRKHLGQVKRSKVCILSCSVQRLKDKKKVGYWRRPNNASTSQ